MIDNKTRLVLRQIFELTPNVFDESGAGIMKPGTEHIVAFASLLSTDASEERLQQFLTENPQFILYFLSRGSDPLAFITKPSIGNSYRGDFGVLSVSQNGCEIDLIEIKQSSVPLFTARGTPARHLQAAMGQIHDWHQWITINQNTFVRDTLRLAQCLPILPARAHNGSFALRSDVEKSCYYFGGFGIGYTIVIGRWGTLSKKHRERLVFLNQHDIPNRRVITFDQLIRNAYNHSFSYLHISIERDKKEGFS